MKDYPALSAHAARMEAMPVFQEISQAFIAARVKCSAMSRQTVNDICKMFPGAEMSFSVWRRAGCVEGQAAKCLPRWAAITQGRVGQDRQRRNCADADRGGRRREGAVISTGRGSTFHGIWRKTELRARLAASYKLIRASLPKKAQAELAAFE